MLFAENMVFSMFSNKQDKYFLIWSMVMALAIGFHFAS